MLKLLDWMQDRSLDLPLVQRARAGDRGAFELLLRAHLPRVYRLLYRLVGSHEDAEDLAQECFVRAWRALELYREQASFSTWLDRIALNLARDLHRRRARRADLFAPVGLESAAQHKVPSEGLAQREMLAGLRTALGRLPETLRTALVLRVFEGREYDDIARCSGVTPATARTQVLKARKLLVRWLAPWLERSEQP